MSESRQFPSTEVDVIAMMYLKNQDISKKSAVEIYEIFHNAKVEIKKCKDKLNKS